MLLAFGLPHQCRAVQGILEPGFVRDVIRKVCGKLMMWVSLLRSCADTKAGKCSLNATPILLEVHGFVVKAA